MNAWEEGSRIVADVMQFEEAPLFPHPDGRPTDPDKSRARLCRWSFDLSGNTDPLHANLPRTISPANSRASTSAAPALSAIMAGTPAPNPGLPMFGALSGIVHVDGKGARLGKYLLPAGDTISEPVFVASGEACRRGRRLAVGGGLARQ